MNRLNFEQEKQLIDFFRGNPSLWNTKDKDYNNRMMRTQKLENIANSLQLTRKDVYEKYRNLRTTFFREHKRVEQSIPNGGSGAKNGGSDQSGYVSKWRHYQNMLFLTKVDKSLSGSGKSDHHHHHNNGNSLHNEDSNSTDAAPPAPPPAAHLNNGHDIELVIDTDTRGGGGGANAVAAAAAAAHNRPVPMDTSGDSTATNTNDSVTAVSSGATAALATGLVMQNALSGHTVVPGSIVNAHLNHAGEDLILVDGIGLVNRTLLTNRANNGGPTTIAVSLPASLGQNSPLTPTAAHSVIYANHPSLALNGLRGLKAETTTSTDLRHLPPQTIILPANFNLNLNATAHHQQAALAGLASPVAHQMTALATPPPVSLVTTGTKTSVTISSASNSNTTTTKSGSSQVSLVPPPPTQSTPLATSATRKGSVFFVTRPQDHVSGASPTLDGSTISAVSNSSLLSDQSSVALSPSVVTASPGSAFVQPSPHGHHQSHPPTHHVVNQLVPSTVATQFAISMPTNLTASSISSSSTAKSSCNTPCSVFGAVGHTNGGGVGGASPITTTSSSSTSTAFGLHLQPQSHPSTTVTTTTTKLTPVDLGEMRELVRHLVAEHDDEEMAFCRSLAPSLRHLDRARKELVKLELQQVIVRHTNPGYNGGGLTNHLEEERLNCSNNSVNSSLNSSTSANNHSTTANAVTTIVSGNNGNNTIQTRSK